MTKGELERVSQPYHYLPCTVAYLRKELYPEYIHNQKSCNAEQYWIFGNVTKSNK